MQNETQCVETTHDVNQPNISDYFFNELTSKVVEFNKICFGDFKLLSNQEKADKINLQLDIVGEEMQGEYRKHYAKDMLEELDAIGDTLFTVSYLLYQLGVVNNLEDEKDIDEINSLINQDQLELLTMDYGNFSETYMNHFDFDIIKEATDRIIDNNQEKYTDDDKEFSTWVAPDGEYLSPREIVLDGTSYYLLVNENGKVRKRKGFPVVNLQDLVDKQVERFEEESPMEETNEEK